MLNVRSDNYDKFVCLAGACPASCCSGGWQIVIDDESLKLYSDDTGDLRLNARLESAIETGSDERCFKAEAGNCVMLDPDGLCSIQKVMGEEGLCATCNMYPRHVEEFEGVREWSLSLSCPEAARLLLTRQDRLTFIETETLDDEAAEEAEAREFEEFDNMFYSMLNDARTKIFSIVQDRELRFREKAVQIAELCDKLQKCIDEDRMFDMDALIYDESEDGAAQAKVAAAETEDQEAYGEDTVSDDDGGSACGVFADGIKLIDHMAEIDYDPLPKELFSKLFDLEILDGSDWIDIIECTWIGWNDELELSAEEEIQAEQLMMFWIYTYFSGAAYDGWIYSKAMLAISSTWWILQVNAANHFEGGIIETACRYAREIEHSDNNLDALEEWFMRRE